MSQEYSIVIPAKVGTKPGSNVAYLSGSIFYCISADAAFQFAPDNQSKISSDTGKTYGSPTGRKFSRLTFYNSTAAPITVTFYAGFENYQSPGVSLVNVASVTVTQTAAVPVEDIYVITADDTPQQILPASADTTRMILLYPASSVSAGKLQPNVNDVYAGLSATYQPDKRAVTDIAYPIVLDCPDGKKFAVSRVRVNGKIGDGFFYRYWPE